MGVKHVKNGHRYWRIRGHDGFSTIFDMKVELGLFTQEQIENLLKALTAKAGLNWTEIVGAYAKRGTKLANHHLDTQWDFPTCTCGSNPHFNASIVDEAGQIVSKRGAQ